MATADETNTSSLPQFSAVKPFEQLAIQLRAEGNDYTKITDTVNAEFNLAYKMPSLREWFHAGGRLEQAYYEYLEWHADQSVIRAKVKIKTITEKAAETLEDLMSDKYDGRVRQQAARTVLGKYIPDRQVVIDESKADDLPSAIGDAGDDVLNDSPGDESNGQDEVVNPPQSEPAGPQPGA